MNTRVISSSIDWPFALPELERLDALSPGAIVGAHKNLRGWRWRSTLFRSQLEVRVANHQEICSTNLKEESMRKGRTFSPSAKYSFLEFS